MNSKPSNKIFITFSVIALALLALFIYFNLSKQETDIPREQEGASLTKKEEANLTKKELKIGFITDVQCYANHDSSEDTWSINWRCIQPLNAFVEKMNNVFKPDIVIENGDFIDGKDKRAQVDFVEIKQIYDMLDAPNYHVLGNHETRSFEKEEWLDMTGLEKTYYHFDTKGYRIIVLDGNNKPSKDGFRDTSPEVEFYPGAIDSEQMQWLKNLLEDSVDFRKLVFVHQPPTETDAKELKRLFWNGAELQTLFEKHGVQSVFSGHIERNCVIEKNGVEYYVLNGFWKANKGLKEEFRNKDGGVFGEITIVGDETEINLHFREGKNSDYQSTIMTTQNSQCLDGSTLADD